MSNRERTAVDEAIRRWPNSPGKVDSFMREWRQKQEPAKRVTLQHGEAVAVRWLHDGQTVAMATISEDTLDRAVEDVSLRMMAEGHLAHLEERLGCDDKTDSLELAANLVSVVSRLAALRTWAELAEDASNGDPFPPPTALDALIEEARELVDVDS